MKERGRTISERAVLVKVYLKKEDNDNNGIKKRKRKAGERSQGERY
jgi:hypothetical protein